MNISHKGTNVLLIGRGLRKIDQLIETLEMVGAQLLYSDDAAEGTLLMGLESPDAVVCHAELRDADAVELCGAIRRNAKTERIPVIFVSESTVGAAEVLNLLNAGADDVISGHFEWNAFLAKLGWIMERRSDEAVQRNEYESLRRRQTQTLEIVRETMNMLLGLDPDRRPPGSDLGQPDDRVEIGVGMIAGLANVIEEQIKASDKLLGIGGETIDPLADARSNIPTRPKEEYLGLALAA